jgi:hypothetical protein
MKEHASGGSSWGALTAAMLDGLRGKRETVCFLLGRGIRVQEMSCNTCGTEFGLPREGGQTFKLHSAAKDAKEGTAGSDGTRLLLGDRVLVTSVNPDLMPILEQSRNFLGDKVLVAIPESPGRRGSSSNPYLFCDRCGHNLMSKVARENRRRYSWDRLAEIEPRPLPGGLRAALRKLKRPPREERESAPSLPQWAPAAALSSSANADSSASHNKPKGSG